MRKVLAVQSFKELVHFYQGPVIIYTELKSGVFD